MVGEICPGKKREKREDFRVTILETVHSCICGREGEIGFSYAEGRKYIYVTYGEFYSNICRLIPFYRRCGHRRIAIVTENSYWDMVHSYAAISAGCACALVDAQLCAQDIAALLHNAGATALFYDEDLQEIADDLENAGAQAICAPMPVPGNEWNEEASEAGTHLCFTSGTSHLSKAVVLSQKALISAAASYGKVTADRDGDVVYLPLPTFHMHSYSTTLMLLMKGAKMFYGGGVRNAFRDLLEYRPVSVYTVPLHMDDLVKNGGFLPKRFTVAGTPCTREVFERACAAGIVVQNLYGATETCGVCMASPIDGSSIGVFAMEGRKFRLNSGNEIEIHGDLMDSYYNLADETAAVLRDGWYSSGDIGALDETGGLYIVGRIKDIIVMDNGEKINCNEVDQRLAGLEGAREIALFQGNGKVMLAIVPQESGASEKDFERQIARFNATQPMSRRISQLWVRKEPLPRTAIGKLKRNAIVQQWEEENHV